MKLLQPRPLQPRKMILPLAVLIAFTVYTCKRDREQPRLWSWSGPAQGATYTIKIIAPHISNDAFRALQKNVDDCLQEMDDRMSTYRADTDISRFNANRSTDPIPVATSLVEVTRQALELSRLSRGAFDITFSPLFDLWGFGPDGRRKRPTEEQIRAAERLCGYRNLRVVSPDTLQKDIPELQITLNAIAPGYTADRLAHILLEHGYTNIYVEVGGEIVAHGRNLHGAPWRVGVERPDYGAARGSQPYLIVHLSGRALATSGNYRNYYRDEEGRILTHILDPRAGGPVTSMLASVSVVATNCMFADGLSTALFVLGPDEGLPLVESLPETEALFIMRDQTGGYYAVRSSGFDSHAR